ncbi:DNA polymerase III subunit gamma/tau [Phaeocystidibacter luteus]|uniref:DNA polymerase III subunit gamma/tau n=1 Tax=Phaeocystidibacter luteus TaxID=911197 RepID=A0A6N6RG26_9FLAO|nr:DNA polymerase III subunit gamma/tau [Phaeocystidibacter luteus]KAB2808022.1 DNA polymerase III subunit gamma/tau [Phaeocystidibacter luteus]
MSTENQYIVSARKYRPQTFESVVGQHHVTNTLENAIAQDHLAQALLFCGPRGVGKTTCARILAKKINEHYGGENEDYSLNIFELDAASNNSVDDIRSLIEQVRFAPQVGKFKVYIIDEVHMLSQAAFNAFLKTLEEPPKHAIFILATTEKHKIIPTILSRCQIFDFKRITVDDIAKHLAWVAEQENITANPDALHLIAQKADGALRDSLSIFDRIASFSDGEISYESVLENLNILDYDYYFRAVDNVMAGDVQQSLLLFREVLDKGFDGHMFLTGLASHFRDLLVGKDPATLELLEVGESIRAKYVEQSAKCSLPFLIQALKVVTEADEKFKASHNQRLHVEVALLRLVQLVAYADEKKNDGADNVKLPPQPQATASARQQDVVVEVQPRKSAPVSSPIDKSQPETQKENLKEELKKSAETKTPSREPITEKGQVRQSGRRGNRLKGFSLKDLDNQPEEAETESTEEAGEIRDTSGLPQEYFSEHELKEVWDSYLKKIEHKKSIFNTLSRHRPTLVDKTTLELQLDNKTQEGYLQSGRADLMAYLRTELKNFKIDLKTTITEKEEVKTLYTPEEKYKHMVEKNPVLAEFRRKLDLDLE